MAVGTGTEGGAAARIERPRLVSRARAALDSGALMLTAGAGYGKTILLEETLQQPRRSTAWIACTAAERDPPRLLLRVGRAFSAAVPGAGEVLAERLGLTAGPIDADAALAELIDDLDRILVEPVFCVLDDAERLESSTGSLQLVGRLLRSESRMLRTAVATRRPLDLRLAKPRAATRLTELSAADLAFTAEESAELAAKLRGRPLSDPEVEALMADSEGWPLGVALLARGAPATAERATAARSAQRPETEMLHSYLAEEVLDSLDPQLRTAVVASSVPSRLTPAIIAALGLPDDTLARIERAGIPLRRSGIPTGSVGFHPLLRELLKQRLAERGDAAATRDLHARVAPALEAEGEVVEAIEHWLEAGAWNEVVARLGREGQELVRTSPGTVHGWIERMPPEVRGEPEIRLLEGQLRWGAGDNPGAAEILTEAAEGLRAMGDSTREWLARLILFDARGSGGNFEGAMDAIEGFSDPATQTAGPFAPAAARQAAMALVTFGRFEESERVEALAGAHPDADATVSLDAVRLAAIKYLRGDLDDAIERLRAAAHEKVLPDPLNLRVYAWQTLTKLLDAAGRGDEAIATWQALERELGGALAPHAAREGHHAQAKLHARAGRLAEAEAELARGGPVERGWRAQARHLAIAWVAALRGDPLETAAASEDALELQPTAPGLVRWETTVDLIPPLAMTGHGERAVVALEETKAMVDSAFPGDHGRFARGYLLALRAWLEDLGGNPLAANRDLEAMWRQAGDARRFIVRREWSRLEPLLSTALERGSIDAGEAVEAAASARPDGAALATLMGHPSPGARRAAIAPALAAGHPEAIRRLSEAIDDVDPGVASAARAARANLPVITPPLRFRVLGEFSVQRGGWRVSEPDWGRPSAARLIRFLLVHASEEMPADAIVDALWQDLPPDRGKGSLHVAVSRARRVLDLPHTDGSVIESIGGAYRLRLGERDSLDSAEFERAAADALTGAGSERRELLERARAIWGGQPLPSERYADWASSWREGLIDRYVEILRELIDLYGEQGDHSSAAAAARELLELDPLNEGAHRELMAAYARTGRTGQALHQYLECRRRLVDRLGIEPSEATGRLQARILAGESV